MNRPLIAGLIAGSATLCTLAACRRSPPPSPEALTSAATSSAVPATSDGVCEAQKTLAQMDTRIAVPLVPMMAQHQRQDMRDHLLAVQEIVTAAATDDFAGVQRAAARIGFSEQMGQKCSHMGAGAPGFTELALAFHHSADTITAAAQQRDHAAVLQALGATLQACTGCHAAYRQSIVDDATWNQLTSQLAPTESAPGH